MTSSEIVDRVDERAVIVPSTGNVVLTPAAVEKVRELLEREGRDDLRLRVAVQPGGCSGLRYELFFDDRLFDTDHVVRYGDVEGPAAEPGSNHESGYGSGSDE